jgi:hypothetical protein
VIGGDSDTSASIKRREFVPFVWLPASAPPFQLLKLDRSSRLGVEKFGKAVAGVFGGLQQHFLQVLGAGVHLALLAPMHSARVLALTSGLPLPRGFLSGGSGKSGEVAVALVWPGGGEAGFGFGFLGGCLAMSDPLQVKVRRSRPMRIR